MKALSFIFLFFSLSLSFYSQKTLWGTVENGGQYGKGYIYRTDSIGNNFVAVHHFDSIHDGKFPGAIIRASNGKLYGMTAQGGHGVMQLTGGPNGFYYTMGGTLYEYDPIIDSFKVLIHFNSTSPQYPTGFDGPSAMKLLEVSPGNLWCVFNLKMNNNGVVQALPRYVAAYDIATQNLTSVASVPSWYTPSISMPQHSSLTGELYKAANGMVYGTTAGYSSCATLNPITIGSVISIDPVSHVFSWIRPFDCTNIDGQYPEGQFEQVGGKLYSFTRWGGAYTVYPANGYGVIFEYDPIANSITKKHDLTGGSGGSYPHGNQLLANNGKLYGASISSVPQPNFPNGEGMLYEFDPATSTFTNKANFVYGYTLADMGSIGQLWLKSSGNGKLYGTTQKGVFEYNTLTDQIRIGARFNADNHYAHEMREICRKPAYKPLAVSSYSLCSNSFFTLNIKCYNATSIVWKHNGAPDASHTTSALTFNQVSLADAGTWVCEMTNECGTTTSSAVTLVVTAAGSGAVSSFIIPSGNTSICPNSTITLSGNVNGTWNTGSTAPSITISNPGSYQVINSNACGDTYSNIITIDTIPSPSVPIITFSTSGTYNGPVLSYSICQGDSLLLIGNPAGGIWNTGETSPSMYVKDLLPRYVTFNNGCQTVISATAQVAYLTPVVPPTIAALGSLTVCVGDSLLLDASGNSNYEWYYDNGLGYYSYMSNSNTIYAKISGKYYIKLLSNCGPVYSHSVQVEVSGSPLGAAIITPLSSTVICQGGSVVLQSNYASCTWNTGATTQTILATGAGPYIVTNYNSCSSVTSAPMTISVTPSPVTNYTEPQNSVCFTTGTYTLAAGSPAGGYYTGLGVSGNTFDPVMAGAGTHTVAYNYLSPSTGCTGKAIQTILVDGNPILAAAPSTVFCQGSNTVLYHDAAAAVWNTGATGQFLSVNQPGTFYVTKTNNCGVSVTSNTLQIISKPSPTITITGNTSICAGLTTTLTGNGSLTYTWTPAIATQSVMVNPGATTIYTLTGQGANGCYASATTTVNVNPLPTVAVTNATICSGTSATLSATGANTYTWSTSQIGASIVVSPSTSTVFHVTGTSLALCTNTAMATVQVSPPVAIPVITLTGNTLLSSPSSSYQWYLNGNLLNGAISQSYTPLQNGNYTVVVHDQNGCNATSATYTILDTGLSGVMAATGDIDVYPNPTTGNFMINTSFQEFKIEIVNTLGQVVLQETGHYLSEFTLEKDGLYMVHIISNGHVYIKKLLVSGK